MKPIISFLLLLFLSYPVAAGGTFTGGNVIEYLDELSTKVEDNYSAIQDLERRVQVLENRLAVQSGQALASPNVVASSYGTPIVLAPGEVLLSVGSVPVNRQVMRSRSVWINRSAPVMRRRPVRNFFEGPPARLCPGRICPSPVR